MMNDARRWRAFSRLRGCYNCTLFARVYGLLPNEFARRLANCSIGQDADDVSQKNLISLYLSFLAQDR
jgi:hypothetical protein